MAKKFDIAAYKASGILEAFVLGTLSDDESREVTALVKQYPELQQEVEEVEAAILAAGSAYAPDAIDASILENALSEVEAEMNQETERKSLSSDTPTETDTPGPLSQLLFNRWMAAASIFLLMSVGLNIYLYNQWRDTDKALISLRAEQDQVLAETDRLRARLEVNNQNLAAASAPNSKLIKLNGLDHSPESGAILAWNAQSGALQFLNTQLPEAPTDFQYQLWAIVDGEPVDAGLLASDDGHTLKSIRGAVSAFAITLEKAGGSPIPSLDQMYVYGELAG